MERVTSEAIRAFLQRLSERYPRAGTIYLLGGSALCLLGNPRETHDIDYTVELTSGTPEEFESVVTQLAKEMQLDLEVMLQAEFIPLPPRTQERRRVVGKFGQLDVYIFDPYSIALSKIARGFEADLEDVMFMLREKLIEFGELERYANVIMPSLHKTDVDPNEFRAYFEEIRRRIKK